ncbi:MAG: hypothetical protein WDO24_13525 [Pseudomonadota bacterium]
MQTTEFKKSGAPRAKAAKPSAAPARPAVVPKDCRLTVKDNRIAEIYEELRTLKLTDARNAHLRVAARVP